MAKFRRRLLKKGPLPFKYVFLLTFVFFVFSTVAGLWVINKSIKPTLMSYAVSETRNIATLVIGNAVKDKMANEDAEIFKTIPNTDGSRNIQLDTEKISRLETEIVSSIQKNIREAEEGSFETLGAMSELEVDLGERSAEEEGIVFHIPLGKATNNALLGSLGPKIPIRFSAIGDVQSDVKTKVTEYGINNAQIEVYIALTVNIEIIIPFATEETTVKRNIPLGIGIFPGDVPQYYHNGGGGIPPAVTIPSQ